MRTPIAPRGRRASRQISISPYVYMCDIARTPRDNSDGRPRAGTAWRRLMAGGGFQVSGTNAAAPFTLKLHRGDGMTLLAMNWRKGKAPRDFGGFAIECKEPAGACFCVLR